MLNILIVNIKCYIYVVYILVEKSMDFELNIHRVES